MEGATHNIKNMAKVLETGTVSQKTLVLFEMPQLLANCTEETLQILVPCICLFVKHWDEDLQIAAAEAFLDVVNTPAAADTKGIILQAALQVITSSTSDDLLESWGEILVLFLPTTPLNDGVILVPLTGMLDSFSSSELEICRKLAARVLGSIATSMSPENVEEHILKHALKLVEDADPEIRGMSAESMSLIGAVTSEDSTATLVWPKVMILLQDNDARIRAVALRAIASIIAGQRKRGSDVSRLSQLVYPMFLEQAASAYRLAQLDQRNIEMDQFLMLEMIAEVYGQLLFSCFPFADDAVRDTLLNSFYVMATCNSPSVRKACAYNLPGVCVTLESNNAGKLASIAKAISIDLSVDTRSVLAAGFHETVRALIRPETVDDLLETTTALLRDEHPAVRKQALKNYFSILSSLGSQLEDNTQKLVPLFESLSNLREGNWRTQHLLVEQLQHAVAIIPTDALRQYILPLFCQLAEESTYVVRKSVMVGIAKAFWYVPLPKEREKAVQNFSVAWGEGGVYWMRMAFIDCVEAAMDLFSKKLFNSLFLDTLFFSADDTVTNVRLRLAKLIPKLAQFCFNSTTLDMAISTLKGDADVDVRFAMEGIDEHLCVVANSQDAFEEESKKREAKETEMMHKAEKIALASAQASVESLRASSISPVPVIEACTPQAGKNENSMTTSPTSPRKGFKALRLHLGPASDKQDSSRSLSLPKINLSPINSPDAGSSEVQSPRRKGIQMLRDLGWTRKKSERNTSETQTQT